MMWLDGEFVETATVPAFSHSVNFGSCVFDTARVYNTPEGPAFFRLGDHVKRLLDGLDFVGFTLAYSQEEIAAASKELVAKNGLSGEAYVRMNAFLAEEGMRLAHKANRASLAIAASPLAYFDRSFDEGLKCCTVKWKKAPRDCVPSQIKLAANYVTSFFASREARANGFDDALMADSKGNISEGCVQNIFIVRNNRLITPPTTEPILPGITRDSMIKLAGNAGIPVEEKPLNFQEVLSASELFFTGTAIGIMPITQVNEKSFKVGGLTKQLRAEFEKVFSCKHAFSEKWLSFL